MIQLNDLLRVVGVEPREVLVFRHRPKEPKLREVLPWFAAEKPEIFNAYQQTQGERAEGALSRAGYAASFIGHEAGKALFVGLYKVGASRPLTVKQYWDVPAFKEMKKFGMEGFTATNRSSILWFELTLLDLYAQWKGKLVVRWPPPERSWWRLADRNEIFVESISDESLLTSRMPTSDALTLTWDQLAQLPIQWRIAMSQWRGIYYIFDVSDGRGYVGSAYGSENILGRWLDYADTGHGGNKRLRDRDPINFRFSILELVAPTLEKDKVESLEAAWKARLHTRAHGLNEN
jgi:hypothetical protein